MYIFLVQIKNEQKMFFYKQYEGLCEKTKKSGTWINDKNICKEATSHFFAYADKDDVIHIICESANSQILYLTYVNNEWHKYIICNINKDIKIQKMQISTNDFTKNLFYSALYQGELILVHCVLGDNAMPETIDKLSDPEFFVSGDRIYYSDSEGRIGYQSFMDSKPDRFIPVYKGKMPYASNDRQKEYITYVSDNNIYVNDVKFCNDLYCENPLIVKGPEKNILIWKNGDIIKYLPLEKESIGKRAMQFVSPGKKINTYVVSDGRKTSYFYGFLSNGCLRFFANPLPFENNEESDKDNEIYMKNTEIKKLQEVLARLKAEIEIYKNEIMKLNDMIKKLKKLNYEMDKINNEKKQDN